MSTILNITTNPGDTDLIPGALNPFTLSTNVTDRDRLAPDTPIGSVRLTLVFDASIEPWAIRVAPQSATRWHVVPGTHEDEDHNDNDNDNDNGQVAAKVKHTFSFAPNDVCTVEAAVLALELDVPEQTTVPQITVQVLLDDTVGTRVRKIFPVSTFAPPNAIALTPGHNPLLRSLVRTTAQGGLGDLDPNPDIDMESDTRTGTDLGTSTNTGTNTGANTGADAPFSTDAAQGEYKNRIRFHLRNASGSELPNARISLTLQCRDEDDRPITNLETLKFLELVPRSPGAPTWIKPSGALSHWVVQQSLAPTALPFDYDITNLRLPVYSNQLGDTPSPVERIAFVELRFDVEPNTHGPSPNEIDDKADINDIAIPKPYSVILRFAVQGPYFIQIRRLTVQDMIRTGDTDHSATAATAIVAGKERHFFLNQTERCAYSVQKVYKELEPEVIDHWLHPVLVDKNGAPVTTEFVRSWRWRNPGGGAKLDRHFRGHEGQSFVYCVTRNEGAEANLDESFTSTALTVTSQPFTLTTGRLTQSDTGKDFVPRGLVVMFAGHRIPSGWSLCDGSNGTPDLRHRFIYGRNLAAASNQVLAQDTSWQRPNAPEHFEDAQEHRHDYDAVQTHDSGKHRHNFGSGVKLRSAGEDEDGWALHWNSSDPRAPFWEDAGAHSHTVHLTDHGAVQGKPGRVLMAFIMKL